MSFSYLVWRVNTRIVTGEARFSTVAYLVAVYEPRRFRRSLDQLPLSEQSGMQANGDALRIYGHILLAAITFERISTSEH